MRIISDFKDYYDPMAAWDDDRETTFVRNRIKPIEVKNPGLNNYLSVIGFAGKFYPFEYETQRYSTSFDYYNTVVKITYDKNLLIKSLEKGWNYKRYTPLYEACFQYWLSEKTPIQENLFSQYGPIFAIFPYRVPGGPWFDNTSCHHSNMWVVQNVCLKQWGFDHILNAALAYNDLKNFINNLARPMKEIPVLSNEDKIEAAGFDLRHSFRKRKQK